MKILNENHADTNTDNLSFDYEEPTELNTINNQITADEIKKCAQNLSNGKAKGLDNILNEHIKSTLHLMLPIYTRLFNLIFDTGIIPNAWTEGSIIPIYKKKGSNDNPENYQPITLLSCLGKLLSAILNTRLQFSQQYMTL